MKKMFFIIFACTKLFCQNQFDSEKVGWDHTPIKYNNAVIPIEFIFNDIVAIYDKAVFGFNEYSNKTLKRTVLLKIINESGLKSLTSVSLPESFDIAENSEFFQQGRLSKIKIPFVQSYYLQYFIARVIKPNGKVINLKPEQTYETFRWIKPTGEYINDNISIFSFKNLSVGDLLEYSYEVEYKPNYGGNMIYLSSKWPKINVEYDFKYLALPENKNYKFILTTNIPDSCVTLEHDLKYVDLASVTEKIKLKNIQRVNYFIHSFSASQLPQVYINLNYTIKVVKNRSYSVANLPDFKWANLPAREDYKTWYIKYPNDIRKFISSMPVFVNDSNSLKFLKAFSDTLNSFKYYSANYMFYNDPRLYSLYSTDHLFKRRLSEMNLIDIYESILDEKGVFYYITNIRDKRLGEHNPLIRNQAYENIILAIPTKKSLIFLVPRYHGLKFFLNELPFYYEGDMAALFPINYEKRENIKIGNHLRFIKTYSGTSNENIRIENSIIKVNNDSLKCSLHIKESLSGQFSTILRPFYLKEFIDSTINPIYFKKCVDKPNAINQKLNLISKSEEYPFKFVFNCSENIPFENSGAIDLTNWFSFVLNKNLIFEKPTHDFYFDFPFSDIYNFVFEFNTAVDIKNSNEINRSINNDYFGLECVLKKQDNTYLLTVITKVKKKMLPKEEAVKLMDFVAELDRVNNLKILYAK